MDLEDQSNFKVHIDEMKLGRHDDHICIYFTIRSFVFHVGHWNSTLKIYNQFFSIKNNFNTNILRMKFYVKEPFVPSKRGGGSKNWLRRNHI